MLGRFSADGTLIDERSGPDHHGAVADRYNWANETAGSISVPGAELPNLACAAIRDALMAFAARLSVIDGPQPVLQVFDLIELHLCHVVCVLRYGIICFPVERCRSLGGGIIEAEDSRGYEDASEQRGVAKSCPFWSLHSRAKTMRREPHP